MSSLRLLAVGALCSRNVSELPIIPWLKLLLWSSCRILSVVVHLTPRNTVDSLVVRIAGVALHICDPRYVAQIRRLAIIVLEVLVVLVCVTPASVLESAIRILMSAALVNATSRSVRRQVGNVLHQKAPGTLVRLKRKRIASAVLAR